MMSDPRVDWCYLGEPDTTIGNRQICWSGGKMLGGSSSINGMVYFRGAASDFDSWYEEGWSFKDVLPYFLKSERFAGRESSLHNKELLTVSPQRTFQELTHDWIRACNELGIRSLDDYCGGDIEGAFVSYCTMRNGWRASTARAFLDPARRRSNLQIITDVEVERILFDGRRAIGVSARQGERLFKMRANREVLLCAGAIGSPAVLLRSGIGSADQLKNHGIAIVSELAGVGPNFHDHVAVCVSKRVNSRTYNMNIGPMGKLGSALKYLWNRTGWLAACPVQGTAYVRSTENSAHSDSPFASSLWRWT